MSSHIGSEESDERRICETTVPKGCIPPAKLAEASQRCQEWRDQSFLSFVEKAVVHERNLMENGVPIEGEGNRAGLLYHFWFLEEELATLFKVLPHLI